MPQLRMFLIKKSTREYVNSMKFTFNGMYLESTRYSKLMNNLLVDLVLCLQSLNLQHPFCQNISSANLAFVDF